MVPPFFVMYAPSIVPNEPAPYIAALMLLSVSKYGNALMKISLKQKRNSIEFLFVIPTGFKPVTF